MKHMYFYLFTEIYFKNTKKIFVLKYFNKIK